MIVESGSLVEVEFFLYIGSLVNQDGVLRVNLWWSDSLVTLSENIYVDSTVEPLR